MTPPTQCFVLPSPFLSLFNLCLISFITLRINRNLISFIPEGTETPSFGAKFETESLATPPKGRFVSTKKHNFIKKVGSFIIQSSSLFSILVYPPTPILHIPPSSLPPPFFLPFFSSFAILPLPLRANKDGKGESCCPCLVLLFGPRDFLAIIKSPF